MMMILRENKTLRELLAAIVFCGALTAGIIAIFASSRVYYLLGLLIGVIGAVFMACHIAYSLEDAVMLNEKDAAAYTRKMTFIRYFVVCALVILTGVTDFASPVTCIIGVLLLKAGAYLQPTVHKLLKNVS